MVRPPARAARSSAAVTRYIAAAPVAARPVLRRIRAAIRAAAPCAEELISYRMPAYRMGRVLVYFAAYKAHIGLYPPVRGEDALARACAPYAGPKGNLRFPLDRPVPVALIARIVRTRVRAAATDQRRPRAR
jgi:uncharacterized protein YdhG (YjbR/CyaY superfamily)